MKKKNLLFQPLEIYVRCIIQTRRYAEAAVHSELKGVAKFYSIARRCDASSEFPFEFLPDSCIKCLDIVREACVAVRFNRARAKFPYRRTNVTLNRRSSRSTCPGPWIVRKITEFFSPQSHPDPPLPPEREEKKQKKNQRIESRNA